MTKKEPNQSDQPKEKTLPKHGSSEEFKMSDDPHCKDGGPACLNCLMIGECLLKYEKQ